MESSIQRRLHIFQRILALLVLIGWVFAPFQTAVASPEAQGSTGGLLVNGAILNLQATPGLVFVHHMTVGIGAESPAVDVTVQSLGFGQALDGSFQAVPADQDSNPLSARSFVTAISNPSFHLDPGEEEAVDVTLQIPEDPGTSTRYAAIYIQGTPATSGNVTQILAVLVPVVISFPSAEVDLSGEITGFEVDPVQAGVPIRIKTTIQNTGNRHYKVKGDVQISDPSGQAVVDLELPLTSTSIIPTYSRELVASYAGLDYPGGLPAGTYTAAVHIEEEDGSSLGTRQVQFEVPQVYRPFPEVDDAHIQISCFKDEEPGTIDAREKTDTRIEFKGVGKVTGCVAIGKYSQPPSGSPSFTAALDTGGIGKTAIKYIGVQVEGFTSGVAQLAVSYNDHEVDGIDPNHLFLATRVDGRWQKLENQFVQTGAGVALGDIQVSSLVDGPVNALGVDDNSATPLWMNPYLLAGAGLVAVIFLAAGVTFLRRRNVKR